MDEKGRKFSLALVEREVYRGRRWLTKALRNGVRGYSDDLQARIGDTVERNSLAEWMAVGKIMLHECLVHDGDAGGFRVVMIGEVAAGKKWGAHGLEETRRNRVDVHGLTGGTLAFDAGGHREPSAAERNIAGEARRNHAGKLLDLLQRIPVERHACGIDGTVQVALDQQDTFVAKAGIDVIEIFKRAYEQAAADQQYE